MSRHRRDMADLWLRSGVRAVAAAGLWFLLLIMFCIVLSLAAR